MSFKRAPQSCIKLLRAFWIFSCLSALSQNIASPSLSDQVYTAFFNKCPGARYMSDATGRMQQNLPSQDIIEGAADTPNPLPPYLGVTRIGVWGDSHTASGDFVMSAIQQWGFTTNSVRPSMIQPAMMLAGVKTQLKKSCISAGWKLQYAHRISGSVEKLNKTMILLTSENPNEFLWFDFRTPNDDVRLKWLNIHFSKNDVDRSLIVAISVDGGTEQFFNLTSSKSPFLQVMAKEPFATVRIRLVLGQIGIQGLAPVYADAPQTLLDIFSTPGAMAKGWNDVNASIIGPLNYEIVIFQYGTNEAMDLAYNDATYTKYFRQSLTAFRKMNPSARCIVIGPPARGSFSNGVMRPLAKIHHSISQIQAKIAREMGCAFWNWQAMLMKFGDVNQLMMSTPPLIKQDQVHLTKQGYELSGQQFGKTIHWKSDRSNVIP